MPFTLDRTTLMKFSRLNQAAMLLMHRGTSDYVGCRCCLLNGVFSGLELGAQAVEKHLKAMLLFAEPGSNARSFNHKLPLLVKAIHEKRIADLSGHLETIEKLQSHYQARYPDNPGKATSASTGELQSIDSLMGDILEGMPVPEEVMLRSGVYVRAIASSEGTIVFPDEKWLLVNNSSLAAKVPFLVHRNNEWLRHAYPQKA